MLVKNPPAEIAPHLTMLGSSAYPIYLFRTDEGAVLFEGGIGPSGPMVCQQMEQEGIDSASVREIVITHAHPDHVMAVPLFQNVFPNAQVVGSKVAAGTLAVEKAVGFFCKMDDGLTEALIKQGTVAEEHRRPALSENKITIDRVVGDRDTIDVADASFQVLETLGHSDCSLSFHESNRGILIISDATGFYMPAHVAWWPAYFADYGAYVDSIKRLASLNAEVLCLSHNGAITGAAEVKAYFAGALSATESYHQRILAETKAGKSVREIAEQLGAEIHEKTPIMPLDFFQKNCGLLVKLSLKHEGIEVEK